jgi:hypothetical protein
MFTSTKTLLAAALVLPALVACPAQVPGTTPPGQSKAGISGNVIKGTAPFENATVRLIAKSGDATSDKEIKTTDKLGNFVFENVPAGTYRVAFDRATPDQRKNNETIYHTAGADTYGFFSTNEFTFDGNATATKQIDQMNVTWSANLDPAPDASVSAPVTFKWNAATDATGYSVRIADASNNTVASSGTLPASQTTFTWDGNNASKQKAAAGQYVWSVNVNTSKGFGGTNVSKFTLK